MTMAAAVAPGTPAAAPAAPAPSGVADLPVSAATHGMGAVLDQLLEEDPTALDAKELEATDEPANEETIETEPVDPAKGLDDDVIFSDKALATKEGIAKARARTLELRKIQHQKYLELKSFEKRVLKRDVKVKHTIEKYVTNKRNDDLLLNNVRSNLQGLHSGDPDTILTALGNLTGTDGIKAYELLTSRIVNRGRPHLDPQVQAIIDQQNAEIAQLKSGFEEKENVGRVSQLNGKIAQHHRNIGGLISANPTVLPNLARVYADDPEGTTQYIADAIIDAHQKGKPVDRDKYFMDLEAQLARLSGQAPQGDGGGPATKQPPTAQRSPGQSVGPRTAAASHSRVPTEDEALRALADDDAFMRQFLG
jgi:hypothetical protein